MIALLIFAGIAYGCRPDERLALVRSATSCTVTERSGALDHLTWFRPASDDRLTELEHWCDTVGPPIVRLPIGNLPIVTPAVAPSALRPGDSLLVVTWNMHVGHGDLVRLVRRLRTELDAYDRRGHVVLLLQEVLRRDDTVPAGGPAHLALPDGIRPKTREALDVAALAHDLGLWLFYAPSMRNGNQSAEGRREDRGNAILSTLPFSDPRVIELPLRQQRRVAVSVDIPTISDEAPFVRFVSAHVDVRAGGDQAAALARLLGDWNAEAPLFVGTDLNALFGPFDARVRNVGSQIQRHDCGGPTYMRLLSLDHVFTSLAPWIRNCGVMSDRYGSDHAPLLARLIVP